MCINVSEGNECEIPCGDCMVYFFVPCAFVLPSRIYSDHVHPG